LVRFADEIVDTFHQYPEEEFLSDFRQDTYAAIERGLSLHPILPSFPITVRAYTSANDLIEAFFTSMEMGPQHTHVQPATALKNIFMAVPKWWDSCACMSSAKEYAMYHDLKPSAQALGAAFQQVIF